MSTFDTKFLCAKAKYNLAKVGRTKQYLSEDLDLYDKRFHEKALDCCYPVDEKY